jgi:hypothetical protein
MLIAITFASANFPAKDERVAVVLFQIEFSITSLRARWTTSLHVLSFTMPSSWS